MIDALAIILSHTLLLLAFWRLGRRADLDDESQPAIPVDAAPFAVPAAAGKGASDA